jgi:hypothetical protein
MSVDTIEVTDRPGDSAARMFRDRIKIKGGMDGRDQHMPDTFLCGAQLVNIESPLPDYIALPLQRNDAAIDRSTPISTNAADVLHDDRHGLDNLADTSNGEIQIVSRVIVTGVVVEGRMPLARRAS